MKRNFQSFLCATALLAGSASAETIWANGVTADGGWYDVNKSYASTDTGDDMMCYAASASNLIAWWQGMNGMVPSGTPTQLNDIWQAYQNASMSQGQRGGDAGYAMAWWLSGVYLPTSIQEAQRCFASNLRPVTYSELKAFEGYYYDEYELSSLDVQDFIGAYVNDRDYWTSGYGLTTSGLVGGEFDSYTLGQMFEDGYGISLSITNDAGSLSHAITLWGVEYNDEGQLCKLWLTDSDDTHYDNLRLVEATVYSDEANSGRVYFYTDIIHEPVENRPNFVYEFGYEKDEKVYIDTVHLLNSNAFTVVPEPATATLSLLALAGLAARRRRK